MAYIEFVWDLDDDPDGNVIHIGQHGLTKDDVAHALTHSRREERSRSSGSPIAFGPAEDGREIAVVYEIIDDMRIYPITAYEVDR
jgi:hypothetical protein